MENKVYSTQSSLKWIALIVVAGMFGTISFLTLMRVDTYLKYNALAECGKISKYEQTIGDGSAKATYPVVDIYNKCIERIGFK